MSTQPQISNDYCKVSLNKENYFQSVKITRYSKLVDNFDKPENEAKYKEFSIGLTNDSISKIEIVNDIFFPITTAVFSYNDLGFYLTSNITGNGKCVLEFLILKSYSKNSTENIDDYEPVFSEKFLVTDVEILSQRLDGNTCAIKCIQIDWLDWNNNLVYSSKTEKPVSDIIEEMFKKTDLDFESEVSASNIKRFYVTHCNNNFRESINYLLRSAVCEPHGLLCIYYDNYNAIYRLTSYKEVYTRLLKSTDQNYIDLYLPKENYFIFTCKDFVADSDISMLDVKWYNYNGSNLSYDYYKDSKFFNFNHETRQFDKQTFAYDDIRKLMPSTEGDKKFEQQFEQQEYVRKDINNYKKNYDYKFENDFYNNVKDVMFYNNVLEFSVKGSFDRNVGQFVNIGCDQNIEISKRVWGVWYITKIVYFISGTVFGNRIYCSKVEEVVTDPEKVNKANEGQSSII